MEDIDTDGRIIPNHVRLEPLTNRRGVEGYWLVRRKPDDDIVFGDLCFRNHIVTPGQVLIRKTALNMVEAFDLPMSYIEDYDLWWRLTMQVGPIAVTLEPVLLYRHHSSNASSGRDHSRRAATDFRWRLLTYPGMAPEQKRTARIGYFHHCLVWIEFGAHYARQGNVKSGLKHAALGVRYLLLYARDLLRARKQDTAIRSASR